MILRRISVLFVVFVLFFSSLSFFAFGEEKVKYLVLVRRASDKQLYANYVAERLSTYDIQMISLEEKNIPNKANRVKALLKTIKQSFDFSILAAQYTIDYGYEAMWEGVKTKMDQPTDEFYWNLDDDSDRIPDFFMSRIVDSSLDIEWKELDLANSFIEIVRPFGKYPRFNKFCSGCIDPAVDGSEYGERNRQEVKNYGFNPITLYDTDSSMQPKYAPDRGLNKENHKKTFQQSFCFVGYKTQEPINVFDNYKGTSYDTLYRAIWSDSDKNGLVDNYNGEITLEEFEDFSSPDYIKRIGILGFNVNNKNNLNIERLGRYFYAFVLSGNINNLLRGSTVSESVAINSDYLYDISFGPPETKLLDVVKKPQIVFEPQTVENNNIIDMGYDTSMLMSIRNTGNDVLKWKLLERSDWISMGANEGSIDAGVQEEVRVTIINKDITLSLPKQIVGRIVIGTNDPNRSRIEIKIKAKGIFNELW